MVVSLDSGLFLFTELNLSESNSHPFFLDVGPVLESEKTSPESHGEYNFDEIQG